MLFQGRGGMDRGASLHAKLQVFSTTLVAQPPVVGQSRLSDFRLQISSDSLSECSIAFQPQRPKTLPGVLQYGRAFAAQAFFRHPQAAAAGVLGAYVVLASLTPPRPPYLWTKTWNLIVGGSCQVGPFRACSTATVISKEKP